MKIGIEAERANNPRKTGVEHYAKQLILHLAELDHENEYVLYLRTQPEDWFLTLPKNFTVKVMPFPLFWTQLRISWEMLIHPVDVLFIPASSMPIIHPKNTVVTVHDLAFMFYPETYTWFTRNFHKFEDLLVKLFAKKIITVSESTKKDLVKYYGIQSERITVVHHGYEQSNKGVVNSEKGIELPEKYVLFLSTLQPRKNLEGLIDAFRMVKEEHSELPHKLLVVGKPGWKFEPIVKKIHDNKDIVVYMGHVTDSERLEVMQKADLLALPSFYEGFGMQILEAFEMNVPVVTSDISSMPEVAEDAAIYFNPHDVLDIKKALETVLFNKQLADALRSKGKERLKNFSWEKCAEETLRVLISNSQ